MSSSFLPCSTSVEPPLLAGQLVRVSYVTLHIDGKKDVTPQYPLGIPGWQDGLPVRRWASPRPRSPCSSQVSSIDPTPPNRDGLTFCSGQGVQRVGMTTSWLEAFPRTCEPFLQEMDDILQTPLSRIIAEGPNSTLTATKNAQPAIMATSIMILRVLEQEFGFKTAERVDVTLGHSLGEFAALVAGGYLEYRNALIMIRQRAEAMARCTREASQADNGAEYGMVALICEPERLISLIETILPRTHTLLARF